MDRHKDVLQTRRGERFKSSRVNWTKLPFIVQMYDIIYAEMVYSRVAVSIEEVFTNKKGETVSKGENYGRVNDIKIMCPKYMSFIDKTGCNNSKKKDGHNAGGKKIVGVDNVPRSECKSSYHRFTLLPITEAIGELII